MRCIEVSHLYINELWGEEQDISLQKGLDIKKPTDRLIMLVDDYHEEGVFSFHQNMKKIDLIFLESNLVLYAEDLLLTIPSNYLSIQSFKKENKQVLFFKQNNILIPLKSINNNKTDYSCAFLGVVWYLIRSRRWNNQSFIETPEEIISILPKKYEYVENQIDYLLKFLKIEINKKLILF
jgi:hypothetical protein